MKHLVLSLNCTICMILATLAVVEKPTIIGGRNANIAKFSYQVSLRKDGCHQCGGVILSQWFVIAAAHCVSKLVRGVVLPLPVKSFTIRAGSASIFARDVVRRVAVIKIHEQYGEYYSNLTRSTTTDLNHGATVLHDLSILTVSQPFQFNKRVASIKISSTELPTGASVVISGWGKLSNNNEFPETLKYAHVKTAGSAYATRTSGKLAIFLLYLLSPVGRGACNGDSGGPAVANNQLVGISSFGSIICGTDFPDVYVNVTYYSKWIKYHAQLRY